MVELNLLLTGEELVVEVALELLEEMEVETVVQVEK
tara:strand:- start:132 stop:239 length:108 start_codon:yes stop_codon:yes gene_type:complete